jgi:hypothetical protein
MPINGMVLKKTGVNAVSGGTDVTYVVDGQEIANGVRVVDSSVTDFRTRGSFTFKNRVPTYNSTTQSWSKEKRSVTFTQPKILESGEVKFNLIRIEREIDPETTVAEANELLIQGGQATFDADLANFWAYGSLL